MNRVSWSALFLCFILQLSCSDETPVVPSNQDSTSGIVERDGTSLRFVREGSGLPTVVIGSSAHYPHTFSTTLRDHLDLIFADGRHFVPSYKPSKSELSDLTLETWADDVEAIRKSMGIDRWVVVGHSVQAQIALVYARKYPQAVSHLVLVAGIPFGGTELARARQDLWASQASESRKDQHALNTQGLEEKLAAAPADRQFVVKYIANAARYWADPKYDSTPLWEGVRTSKAFDQLAKSLPGRSEVQATIDKLTMPTLVVVGKHDYAVPYTIWESLAANNPSVSYVLMEQDSHNPQAESPDRFDQILLNWLDL